jgi:hypothetical protein
MANTEGIGGKFAILLGIAVAAAPACVLADGASEKVTAQMHADLAAHAADLAGVHTHLHHTLNCLVGPSGVGFDPKEMNPCANAGHGAIPDTADPAKKKALSAAADKAKRGIAAADVSSAQKIAAETAAMLKGK